MIPRFIPHILLILPSLLTGCARAPVSSLDWPTDIPPLKYFEAVYSKDKENQQVQTKREYLTWVVRFYKGWKLYQDGWDATTRNILYSINNTSLKKRLEIKLSYLGKLISSEWAKNSPDRLIRSRELSIWGRALLVSIDQKKEERLVDLVTRDVNAVLTGNLEPSRISLNRY